MVTLRRVNTYERTNPVRISYKFSQSQRPEIVFFNDFCPACRVSYDVAVSSSDENIATNLLLLRRIDRRMLQGFDSFDDEDDVGEEGDAFASFEEFGARETRKLRGYLEDLDHKVCGEQQCEFAPAW